MITMNAIKSRKLGVLSVLAVLSLVVVACSPMFIEDETDAANPATTINIQPGQSWSWTPTFTSGLSPTVTVSGSDSAMPADNATFGASSGNASVSNGKVTVSIPSNFSKSVYYVKVKAQTTQPTQTVYYEITFNVASFSMAYNITTVNAKVGTAISNMTPTVTGATASSYAISGTLPTGLSFNTSTGVISGTPTAYKAQTTYTITATLSTVPVQTVSTTVSIGAFTNITASNYTVYAIKGSTAISVPGVSMPTGTSLQSCTATVKEGSGSATNVTFGTASNGMTVAANTGAITGTPSKAATFTFTETYTATAATGGSSATRTVTVVVEDAVAVANKTANSFVGHSDTSATVRNNGLAAGSINYSITGVTKDGNTYSSPTATNKFSVGTDGKVTCGTAVEAGTYVVTVKAITKNTTTTTSGATGANASSNYKTATVTFVVAPVITCSNANVYTTVTNAATEIVGSPLTSNITGATFSATTYGTGISSSNVTVASDGVISIGSTAISTAGNYTVTVTAQDPNNAANTGTGTVTVHVVGNLSFTNTPTAGAINA